MRTVIIIILAGIVLVGGALTYVFLQPTDCGNDSTCLNDALASCSRAYGTITTTTQTEVVEPITVHGQVIEQESEEITLQTDIKILGNDNGCRVEIRSLNTDKTFSCTLPERTELSSLSERCALI